MKGTDDEHALYLRGLRTLTVDLILRLRRDHLAGGGNPLTHWDRLLAVARTGANQATGLRDWCDQAMRRLQIESPGRSLSSAIRALDAQLEVGPGAVSSERHGRWLDMVSTDAAYLVALARVRAEELKGRKDDDSGL